MFRRLACGCLVLILLTGLTLAQDDDKRLVGDVIAQTPELTLFAQALDYYGDNALLNNTDVFYTVFALDDATFLQLLKDMGGYTSLASIDNDRDKTLLGDILRYHIVPGFLTADALNAVADRFDEPVKLAGGLPGTVITLGDRLLNGETKITTQDIAADNGVIYIIDSALIPDASMFANSVKIADAHNALIEGYAKHQTIAQQLRASDNFTLLTKVLEITGILAELDSQGPYTVFVMNDESLNRALENAGLTFDAFINDRAALTQTLKYHMLPGMVSSAMLQAMDGVLMGTMLPGALLTFGNEDDFLTVNGARILTPDVLASNGIIHVIDGVLFAPEADE